MFAQHLGALLAATYQQRSLIALMIIATVLLSACGGGKRTDGIASGPLIGDPMAPAVSAITEIDIDHPVDLAEVETLPGGRQIIRTSLKIRFRASATVAQLNELLRSIGASITAADVGQDYLIVRIPDPGSVQALNEVVRTIESEHYVSYVLTDFIPAPAKLPENARHSSTLANQLAVGAHAAWNAAAASYAGATLFVIDFFGYGRLSQADAAYTDPMFLQVPIRPPESIPGEEWWDSHGYGVVGVIAGTFGGLDTERGWVTGLMPKPVSLAMLDLPSTGYFMARRKLLVAARKLAPITSVVNLSIQHRCSVDVTCLPVDEIRKYAIDWINDVRGFGVEETLLMIAAAGNSDDAFPGVTEAIYRSELGMAALGNGVVDGDGNLLAPLRNVLIVENALPKPAVPFDGALCINARSMKGGDVAAIGTDVFTFTDASQSTDFLSGTSFAAPQVAALAAYMLSIDNSLKPVDIKRLITETATPISGSGDGCRSASGVRLIQAYEAIQRLDKKSANNTVDLPVRRALLDINGDGWVTEHDIALFMDEFKIKNGTLDFGRADLNGDRYTGGENRRAFDLDANGKIDSVAITANIRSRDFLFDESSLTDFDILCYYSYSSLFAGSWSSRDAVFASARQQGLCGHPEVSGLPLRSILRLIDDLKVTMLTSASGDPVCDPTMQIQQYKKSSLELSFEFEGRCAAEAEAGSYYKGSYSLISGYVVIYTQDAIAGESLLISGGGEITVTATPAYNIIVDGNWYIDVPARLEAMVTPLIGRSCRDVPLETGVGGLISIEGDELRIEEGSGRFFSISLTDLGQYGTYSEEGSFSPVYGGGGGRIALVLGERWIEISPQALGWVLKAGGGSGMGPLESIYCSGPGTVYDLSGW